MALLETGITITHREANVASVSLIS